MSGQPFRGDNAGCVIVGIRAWSKNSFTDAESSAIVDAVDWIWPGSWILDVQAHDTDVVGETAPVTRVTRKAESGQLLLKIAASQEH